MLPPRFDDAALLFDAISPLMLRSFPFTRQAALFSQPLLATPCSSEAPWLPPLLPCLPVSMLKLALMLRGAVAFSMPFSPPFFFLIDATFRVFQDADSLLIYCFAVV